MASLTEAVYASIWEDSDATCMARVTMNGSNITQAVISSITRKLYDEDSATPTTAVDSSALTVASVVFDTLQTDGRWTEDATGYNFRSTVAASLLTSAHRYRVEFSFVGSGGEKFVLPPFFLTAQEVYAS